MKTTTKLNKEQVSKEMKERLRMRKLAIKEIKEWVKFHNKNEEVIKFAQGFAYKKPVINLCK